MSLDSPSRQPDDLTETLRELDRRLRALEGANRLTSASIGSGGLRVRAGGQVIVDSNNSTKALTGVEFERTENALFGFTIDTIRRRYSEVVLPSPDWAVEGFFQGAVLVEAHNDSASNSTLRVRWNSRESGQAWSPGPTWPMYCPAGEAVSVGLPVPFSRDVSSGTGTELAVEISADHNWGSNASNHSLVGLFGIFRGA